jgi:hypothetical protein
MAGKVNRVTVDLVDYPDLVVIYLGMRVNSPRGLKTVLQFGPRISSAVAEKPEGLLLHENLLFSLFPLHVGMRQYWRDFDALEAWARSMPHQKWWQDFVRDSGGTAFWHETYFLRRGIRAYPTRAWRHVFGTQARGVTGRIARGAAGERRCVIAKPPVDVYRRLLF